MNDYFRYSYYLILYKCLMLPKCLVLLKNEPDVEITLYIYIKICSRTEYVKLGKKEHLHYGSVEGDKRVEISFRINDLLM